jgi:hypothetical protein
MTTAGEPPQPPAPAPDAMPAPAPAPAPPLLAPSISRKIKEVEACDWRPGGRAPRRARPRLPPVPQVLATPVDSPPLAAALASLNAADATPTAVAAAAAARGVATARAVLAAAEGVLLALDAADADAAAVADAVDAARAALAAGRSASAAAAADARSAAAGAASVDRRRGLVATFLEQYQLTPAESDALAAGPAAAAPPFFAALRRARQVRANCRSLLRGAHQRAGLDLMDAMSSLVEGGYERLCRWVAGECAGAAAASGASTPGPALRAAFAALADRPSLLEYALDEWTTARAGGLFQRFLVALTRGADGAPPLEDRAPPRGDAVRYATDVLAWTHAAAAGEADAVGALLEDEGGGEGEGERDGDAASPPAVDVRALVARATHGLARPLATRLDALLLASPPARASVDLAGVAAYYASILSSLAGPASPLAEAASSAATRAAAAAAAALAARRDALQRAPPRPGPGLAPAPALLDLARDLADWATAAADAADRVASAGEAAQTPTTSPPASLAPVFGALDSVLAAFLPAAAAGAAAAGGPPSAAAAAAANAATALAGALRGARGSMAAAAAVSATSAAAKAAADAAAAAAGELLDAALPPGAGAAGLASVCAAAAASAGGLGAVAKIADPSVRVAAAKAAGEAVAGAYAARWAALAGAAPPPGARAPAELRLLLGLQPQ